LQVADLNALAELGKVYQDSLALSAQLRNLSSFRLQQDKVLGRGSLAVVQEGGERAMCTVWTRCADFASDADTDLGCRRQQC
jgi:hypothetical protein